MRSTEAGFPLCERDYPLWEECFARADDIGVHANEFVGDETNIVARGKNEVGHAKEIVGDVKNIFVNARDVPAHVKK